MFDYKESRYVACLIWLDEMENGVFEKADIENTIFHKFEDTEFRIPANYEKILKQFYGDYMRLLPPEKRVGHHFYKIYKKDEVEE